MENKTQKLQSLQSLAELMDNRFTVPGTSMRFGLDALLGLIPGVGDTITLLITAYIISAAHQYKLPWHLKGRMIFNAGVDWLIGLVPLIGDIFDLKWRANLRNVRILHEHLAKNPPQ